MFRACPLRDGLGMRGDPSVRGARATTSDRLARISWSRGSLPARGACSRALSYVRAACRDEAIKVRVRRGHLHPLYRGVYAVGHPNVTTEGRWLAAVKACGDYAALSHYAAACHHRWLRWDARPIDITCISRRRHPRIRSHETTKLERIIVRRIPVTPRLRTITDLARTEDEATVTRALRTARFTEAELQQLPRTGLLGRIINLSTAPTASGNEDVVLDLVLNAGFAHPLVNVPVPGLELHPRPLVARRAPARRSRQPRIPRGATRPTRGPQPPSLARSQGRTRPQDHQAPGPPRPGAVLPASQSGRSACRRYHTRMIPSTGCDRHRPPGIADRLRDRLAAQPLTQR